MPEIDIDVRDRLASRDIDELDVDVGINTVCVFTNIPSNVFAVDNCEGA